MFFLMICKTSIKVIDFLFGFILKFFLKSPNFDQILVKKSPKFIPPKIFNKIDPTEIFPTFTENYTEI